MMLDKLIVSLRFKRVIQDATLKALGAAHAVVDSAPVQSEDWPEMAELEDALLELHQLAEAEAGREEMNGMVVIDVQPQVREAGNDDAD